MSQTQANDNSFEITGLGLLPKEWDIISLGDILEEMDVRCGDVQRVNTQDIPVLSLTKEAGIILQSDRFHKRIAVKNIKSYKYIQNGWFVYNPYVIWEGAIHILKKYEFGAVSPVYPTWKLSTNAHPLYIDYLLRTPLLLDSYLRLCSGVVKRRRSISKPAFLSIKIPFPPLIEQVRIGGILSAIQLAKEKTENAVRAAKELKKSLMKYLFTYGAVPVEQAQNPPLQETDFGTIPLHWKIMPLERCSIVQTGIAKGRRLTGADIITVPYLRVANVQDGYLNLDEMKYIDIRRSEVDRFLLRKGDIVLTEGGDFDKLGRGFIWQDEIPSCVHQNHIFAVRADPTVMSPQFLGYMVQSGYAKAYFLSVAHKTTNLACINTTKLKALPVLVPSRPEQERIASMLGRVDHRIRTEGNKKKVLDELFLTLLHNLMTGKVRVNDLEI
ncbi:MAG TPA: restriction endonuclease subunit S [Syntrophobacteraceae bacterium]|nr:restriction endonuclease subunit S [Syntrophobacteraceae bacterium]